MRTTTRSKLLAAAVLPVLLGVAACGSATTRHSEASVVNGSGSTSSSVATSPTRADATALFGSMVHAMQAKKYAHLSMTAGPVQAKGVLAYAGGTPELQMSMSAASMTGIDVRFVGGAMYMSLPQLTGQGKFIKVEASSAALGSLVGQVKGMSPARTVDLMRQSLVSIKKVGVATIDGVPTDHYALVLDTRASQKLLHQVKLPAGAKKLTLPRTIHEDLWVGRDDLLRRVTSSLMGVNTRLDYTDWGTPVQVAAPPASAVVAAPPGL